MAARSLATLSPMEAKVAQGILDGFTSKEIARQLGNSHRTVETHRARVFDKLGVMTALDLMRVVLAATERVGLRSSLGPTLSDYTRHLSRRDLEVFSSAPRPPRNKGAVPFADILTGIAFHLRCEADAVSVFMMWDSAGTPSAVLQVPPAIGFELRELHYPPLTVVRPLSSAIAYGLLLALLLHLPLHLTGERQVWRLDWGKLPSAPSQDVQRRA